LRSSRGGCPDCA